MHKTKWGFRTTDVYFVIRTAFETGGTGMNGMLSLSLDMSQASGRDRHINRVFKIAE